VNIIERINALNTTNTRILDSIGLANFVVVILTIDVTLLHWEPTPMQLKVLAGVGGGILTMMGFDVLQFWGKRFSDAGYAAAKNPNQPVVTNVVPEQSGDSKSAPGSLSRTLEQPVPVLTRTDAQVAAEALEARQRELAAGDEAVG
jgi:hypothetical protein